MMNTQSNSTEHWPAFAPIKIDYDQSKLEEEIKNSGIFSFNRIATSLEKDGRSRWDDGKHFKSEQFKNLANVPLWKEQDKVLTAGSINTFNQVNVTHPGESNNIEKMWVDTDKGRFPLWIAHHYGWEKRDDIDLPYLFQVIKQLDLDFVSMVRIVNQAPPSIGLIHRDSLPSLNKKFFDVGGVSITLNVSTGGADLFFINSIDEEIRVDSSLKAWHFDDSFLHCTNETSSRRIQIRIYGQSKNYKGLMDINSALW